MNPLKSISTLNHLALAATLFAGTSALCQTPAATPPAAPAQAAPQAPATPASTPANDQPLEDQTFKFVARANLVNLVFTVTDKEGHFKKDLRRDKAIIGVCKLIKLGRTLAIGEVSIYSEGNDEMVAHAVGTYAIPQAR